jgi:hypothetical protein
MRITMTFYGISLGSSDSGEGYGEENFFVEIKIRES